ncbi:hypothetical protein KTO58_03345 [Chitinophaga pendula]|uniref:hypothetical protein n=1 Tax=Chitinophaga TaxID=79328 RepID=UPI000BAFDA7B|nr:MULTISPECIES: hypothetical protein [Chitinophaga]ASZ14131.1 hypothetical protein CK934_25870 [Chitinophaga sp. MD30]UCJ08235.1 hypothetical protein KTO58_03345 [Chitinophaga pendula]
MEVDLKNKVKEWLDKQGYPLEMYVAAAFQESGFKIAQSVMYVDPDSKTPREVDLVAHKTIEHSGVYISFAIVLFPKQINKYA